MKPGLAQQLIDTFPALFSGIHPMKGFSLFAFECGNGWFSILKTCIGEIGVLVQKDSLDVKISQIKEKYETLRFYVDGGTDEIYKIIEKAEEQNAITCEACGEPGRLKREGWHQVLCDGCREA